MKTIDEAIKHCEEVTEELEEEDAKYWCDDTEIMNIFIERAKEYRQLADWLRELEWRRNAMVEIQETMLMPASMAERISEEVNADEDRT